MLSFVPPTSEDSGTSVIILETYGANPNILRADQEEESTDSGAEASEESLPSTSDSSLNLSGVSDYSSSLDPSGSNESDDGDNTDHSSQTDTSTETLVCDVSQYESDQTTTKEKCTEYDLATGALIEYPNEDSEDESLIRSQTFDDLSSIGENGDSLFYNFEEELERVERQYPNLQAKDLLIEEEVEEGEREQEAHAIVSQWACEAAKEGSRCFTITEEGEEEYTEAVERREKLETTMGQYYSSGSGGGVSRGDMSGSLPSSPRSSEEWRVSMASTATVASTATADSDDTVAKDMSELSSINSRLSYLDEAQDEVKNGPTTPPTVDANGTLKATPQLDHKRQASIKDAIDELESIEQAAQTLLQKRQYSPEDERGKPVSGSETMTIHSSTSVIVTTVTVGEKVSPLPERKMPPSPPLQRHFTDDRNKLSEKSEKERLEKYEKCITETSAEKEDKKIPSVKPDDGDHFQKTEALASLENLVSEGDSAAKPLMEDEIPDSKSEVKPPLPPVTGSQPAKLDVKRRCLSRSKEIQPYISRESYNDDRVLKELERLRRSYQESDLNDFLDALEHTAISDDLEEAFLRQLLADISEDVEGIQEHYEDSTQLQEGATVETTESLAGVSSDVPAESPQPSPAAGKFEKVKERILEMITVRKAGRVIDTGSLESPATAKEDIEQVNGSGKDDSGLSEAPQICRSVTPQSLRPDTPDSKSSRPHTPDVTKGEDSKKGFNIADLLKKGSPKYLRKKYKERKNRKSDLMTTSESESEDPDGSKKDSKYHNGVPLKKETSTESQSSLKGSNRSLTSSQEVKKEVRFDLENGGEKKELEESDSKGARTDSTKPMAVEKTTKELHRFSGPQLITCEAQQQETVIPREFEETTEEMDSDLTILLPSTVEDINNLAENLLPRLPGRPRPPRKKKKLIPASVEELSGELSDNSSSTVNSDGSVKMVDPKIESLKINVEAKEESPPPLPSYEEVSELPETTPTCVEVIEGNRLESKKQDEREESVEISVISENATAVRTPPCSTVSSVTVALDTTMTSSSIVTTAVPLSSLSVTTVTSSAAATTVGTEVSMKDNDIPDSVLSASALASMATTSAATDVSTSAVDGEVLVAPLPMTSIVSISVAPTPETATLVMYPPRSLPLPVIQESLQEDQVSLPTPNEPRVSLSSHSGSAPITPQDEEEKVPSLYDNVNPFKEMLELESKLLQDTVSESPAVINSSVEIQTETVKEEAVQEPETPKNEMKADHFDFPQEACKSPDMEKTEIVDIDALAALTTEMFRFAEDLDMKVCKKENKPLIDSKASVRKVDAVAYTSTSSSGPECITGGSVGEPIKTVQHPDTLISTTDSPKPQEVRKNTEMKETVTQTEPDTTSRSMSVKEMATSNTVGVQTDSTKYVRMYDTASQTDTEYETDLETESEMEENGTSKYDASKWLFRPTRQSKGPLPAPKDPQLQELHKQQQMMIQELQQQTVMQQRRQKEKPEVPPRQFQEKMPLRVVDELKAVLSESEDAAPRLKKVVDPPPRWDSKFSWDDGRLVNNATNNSLEPSKTLATITSAQADASHFPPVPPGSPSEPSSQPVSLPLPVMQSPVLVPQNKYTNSERNGRLDRRPSYSVSTDDLATIPEEVLLPSARVVGDAGDSQQAHDETGDPPAASQDKQTAPRQPESPAEHVKGNDTPVDPKPGGNITTAKVRANVYPSFAPIAKIPKGKPPVPRPAIRRLSSESLEEGYQSDPGGARRNGGRHKQVPTKIKPSTPAPEDRGYATDSEVLMKTEASSPTTLRSTWTPIGHSTEWVSELGHSATGNGKRSVELTPQATPAPVPEPSPEPPPVPPPPPDSTFDNPASRSPNILSLLDLDRDVAYVTDADCPAPSDSRLREGDACLTQLNQQHHNYNSNLPSSPPDASPQKSSSDTARYIPPMQDSCNTSTIREESPPPLPPPPTSPRSPHDAWLLAPGTVSVDRGIATAQSLYPCQPSHPQSDYTTDLELSYRTERPRWPLTWCPQSTLPAFSHDQLHDPTTATHEHRENPKLPGGWASSCSDCGLTTSTTQLAPGTHPLSHVGPYGTQRLQAQGLAEWLFFARLDRTNKRLSHLPSTMELKPSPQVNGSSEVNGNPTETEVPPEDSEEDISREAIVKSAKYPSARLKPERSASPPPPPRPRTPIDERDPELVYAERRYLSYFQGPPCRRRQARSPSLEPPEPTFQQLEAQRRYNSYFLGGPRSSTPIKEDAGRSPEPDEAQLAAQKRYQSYFEPGPPRPRSTKSQEPPEPDAQQLRAQQRYLSYFNAGPSRVRHASEIECASETDAEQLEAERRYLKYFNPGPPRPPPAKDERTPEPDAEQLEAERRYLAYFKPGPPRPRPRPSSMVESSPEPDAQQLEAERRYLNYFKTGPPRPRPSSAIEVDKEPDEQQLEAEKRYLAYFQGTPKAKRKTDEEKEKEQEGKLRVPPTREMLEAEERFLSYFKPIPSGEPKHIIAEPPLSENDKIRQQLMKEYWEAMETRVDRKEKKIIKVSRPKREVKRETTPPTQRELVVEEFLQRVKDRKKEKDLHYGDTDDEEEDKDTKVNSKEGAQNPTADDLPTPTIEGGGEVKGRIVEDLGLFVSEEGECQ